MAPQPEAMAVHLFPYQRQAISRMMAIEDGISITINGKEVRPRGGVVCDRVGMGKTAEVIGLCLLRPPSQPHSPTPFEEDNKENGFHIEEGKSDLEQKEKTVFPTLVICPDHLCSQWVIEIAKLAPTLRVAAFFRTSHAHQSDDLTLYFVSADIIVTSLDVVMGAVEGVRFPFEAQSFHRVVVDECHDVVAQGATATNRLSSLMTERFWCVTGTPFARGDESAYGINQLLHIRIKFILSGGIFALPNKPLPPEHDFEVLKRHLYIRCKRRSGADVAATGDTGVKHSTEVISLEFTPIEWAFYREEARQIATRDIFADKYKALRQLCCHPASSSKWMKRSVQTLYI